VKWKGGREGRRVWFRQTQPKRRNTHIPPYLPPSLQLSAPTSSWTRPVAQRAAAWSSLRRPRRLVRLLPRSTTRIWMVRLPLLPSLPPSLLPSLLETFSPPLHFPEILPISPSLPPSLPLPLQAARSSSARTARPALPLPEEGLEGRKHRSSTLLVRRSVCMSATCLGTWTGRRSARIGGRWGKVRKGGREGGREEWVRVELSL